MAEKNTMTDEQRKQIADLAGFNVPAPQISDILGIHKSNVYRALAAIELIKSANWDKYFSTPYNYTRSDIEFCSKHFNVEIPKNTKTKERGAEPEKTIAPDNTAVVIAQLIQKLETMTQAVERLNGRLANIQSEQAEHFKHLEEIVSLNTDIISETQHKSLDVLNGIKMNTKKKGVNINA